MTINRDTSVCRATQPCVDHPQEALGFVAAPSVLVITPLPDVTNKKSHAAQIDWVRMAIYKIDSTCKNGYKYDGRLLLQPQAYFYAHCNDYKVED
jgi:hypothetical protein